jgi:septum formation topological specificity factor MinE
MPDNMRDKVKWPFDGRMITRSEARNRLHHLLKTDKLGTAIENLKLIAKRPFDKPVASKDEALRRLEAVIGQDRSTSYT